MKETSINGKYKLLLPDHRSDRAEWQTGWETERIDSMLLNLEQGELVIDVGTEEGDISALLAKKSKRIILVEPNLKVWSNIKAIWEANELEKPLAFYTGFLSNTITKNQPQSLYKWCTESNDEIQRDHGFKNLSEEGAVIPQTTFDELVSTIGCGKVDMINIDVEGSEFEVLRGAKRILTFDFPLVYVSIHPEFMFWHHHQYTQELMNYMNSLGYIPTYLAFDHEFHYVFSNPHGKQLKL